MGHHIHFPGAIVSMAAAVLAGASGTVALAQGAVNLDAPPADYRSSKPYDDLQKPGDASKVRAAPGGVSLSVSGSAAAEVTTSSGGASRAGEAPRR
jgi:hypothetical protein